MRSTAIKTCPLPWLLLRIARLIKLHLEVPGHPEVGDESVAAVCHRLREFHAFRLQLRHGLLDIVAIERNIVRPGSSAVFGIGGVASHVGLGELEDEPSVADIGGRKSKLVTQEGAELLGLRGIEHRVHAADHGTLNEALGRQRVPSYLGLIAPALGQLESPTRFKVISKNRTGSFCGMTRSPTSCQVPSFTTAVYRIVMGPAGISHT